MSVKTILFIVWFFLAGSFAFFGDINFLSINDKEIITNPILKILFTFAVLPILGIILMYIGAILAYPLIYLFKLLTNQ